MPARNQKQSDVFDLAASPLEAGVTLIEASAGTGKTYSLAGLILRLVTEELIPIKEILAVTFTIAATAELKERVRARLYDAFRQLKDEMPKDALTAQIAARTRLNESQRAIELALHSFDDAQVFTIHSFCQRVLQDYAFESGITFDGELVPDPSPLFREVAADFWRLKLSSVSNLVGAICISRNTSPSEWVQLLDRIRNHSDVAFIPPEHSKPLERLVSGLEDALGKVREEWQESGLEIERILRHDRALCRTRAAFHRDRVTELLRTIEQACGEVDCSEPAWLDATKELSTETIKARTRDNCAPPEHRFFQLCSKLQATVETVLLRLTYDFIEYQKREIPLRKTRTNTLSFDDLILKLREALQNGKQGKQLAKALRNSYRAVLVDEFQDTDPAQYAIFKHVFGAGAHHLYYIGDPKQAIYGFRGADVFTYLTATSDATRRLTLQTNWRAEDHLVRAVNTLFRQSEHPFILQKIAYHEITAAPEADFAHLAGLPKSARAPLSFRLVASTRPNASAMNKAEATAAVCEAVAADIHRLGSSRALLDHRTITFGDMAVLVRTHKEAEQVQDALRQQGIRSIVQSDVSVFASIEAAELHRFLHGVLEPARETLFKGALISSLVGLTGHDLVELDTDDTTRQAWLDKFFEWRNRWSTECFIAAFRQVVVDENVRARLVNLPAGERRLTNFLHLAELLHIAETTQRLRPDALLSWLGKQCQVDRVAQEQFQLRLESDTDAVQVITVHKAKGLEYPVVFCPFLWASADPDWRDKLQFHDRAKNNALTFSLRGKAAGSDKQRAWATEETRSEEVRMLYVAITRAKNRCTIYLPEYQRVPESALALLLREPARNNLRNAFRQLAQHVHEAISVSKVKPAAGEDQAAPPSIRSLTAQPFNGRIDRTAMIASFSGLSTGRSQLEEREPEISDPAQIVVQEQPTGGDTIFDFPRGARAGDFFHAVMERLDFGNPELGPLVDEQLVWHGFAGHKCRDAIIATLRTLLEVELISGLALKNIPRSARIAELEFTYRLSQLAPAKLYSTFKKCTDLPTIFLKNIERLRFDPIKGYLRGFIDLLFEFNRKYYLIDWKSNWLGNRGADYGEAGMRAAMVEHNYFLQAHLYVVAADRYLTNRSATYSYEKNFGGVFYVFLRGLDLKNPTLGIFTQRPDLESIAALRELAT